MADSHEKGAFQADIPTTAVEEALRSVERLEKGGAEEPGAAAPEPGAAEGEALAPDEVIRLQTQLELAQVAEREAQERLREERDRLLRAAADLENFKKRAQRERDEIQKFGIERVLKDLLPVLDDLDRALAAAPAGDPMAEGVQLVRAGFEQALARHGVKGFSALGQPFDPNLHEALMQVPTAEAPPGTVVLQHARGFTLHERLLRPAMVGVAIEPPSGA